MQNRGVIKVLFLSLITCGIYSIYWYYVTAQALNEEQPDDPLMNYIGAFLLGIVTCGIYELYWFYKFYKKVDTVTSGDSCLVNFLVTLFFTPLIGQLIAQSQINAFVDKQ